MKVIPKIEFENQEKIVEDIINEIQIIGHQKIIKILEFYKTKLNYFLITEYCKEGELFY